ncbi:MAG: hypothetical protein AB1782_19580 [Cyanobacteriota bacterium]
MIESIHTLPPATFTKKRNLSFSGQNKTEKKNYYPAISSLFIPGSGQMLNGESSKGIKIFASALGLEYMANKLLKSCHISSILDKADPKILLKTEKLALKSKSLAGFTALAGFIGLTLYSVINAFKYNDKDSKNPRNTGESIASYILPGIGQMLNGQVLKGLGLFTGSMATALIAAKFALTGNIIAARKAFFATGVISLYSAVDAYKTPKS